ncbi:glycosyl hydrolase [Emticicia sp. BO119]|uniref:glycosyl hydrolase n=1 Tax=Emticicia sp. BO119 TaxID=2757768 RepID=UPI0015F12001|nr:glycosyl hydrolase [Emticicia sp. BO119]MBA4852690.1 glycoside hydrolase [Emticicia sp. BO119]
MKRFILFFCLIACQVSAQVSTTKPWAYWWWMGSAVTKEGIRQNLQEYAKAGFGGMHIIPIYGVKGEESKFLPFLSKEWLGMLDFTLKEAKKNNLGIDLTLGTGWPFGGKNVSTQDAAQAFKVIEKDGKYTLTFAPTNQKVKRAAPGGEGLVVDPFNKAAIERYLQTFNVAFGEKKYPVRAFYNDSYEAYGANWTANFFQRFKELRRYDLQEHLDVLAKEKAETEKEKLIWGDYNETLSDILREDFTKTWVNWSKQQGKITRNEAHGSPANILDLYAIADIPETEFFGSKPYDIPLSRIDPDYEVNRFGVPDALVLKLASSVSNVMGKKLVSSETATWLGNHFKVSLSQVKPIIDESFIGGVNHIFYHGLPYSPPNEPFPGWLFYASTNFNQQSHFWEYLPELNSYITRCQEKLQNSRPDNDILMYFPIHDLWQSVGNKAKTHAIDVHAIMKDGMLKSAFGDACKELTSHGYSFDFISDLQLKNTRITNKQLITQGKQVYKAIIVPPMQYLPVETLAYLEKCKSAGVPVFFVNRLPKSTTGFHNWDTRQKQFEQILSKLNNTVSANIIESLKVAKIRKEPLAESGLSFIRKKNTTGTIYFVSNLGNQFKQGNIHLAIPAQAVKIYDPLHQKSMWVNVNKINTNLIEIPLALAGGESVFIEAYNQKPSAMKISPVKTDGEKIVLKGNWKVDFVKGEPFIPHSFQTDSLQSWVNMSDSTAQYFSGTAHYQLQFSLDKNQIRNGYLDLGDVREMATVKLNGKDLGKYWSLPFRVPFTANMLSTSNKLEIEVTNLSANRIRYLDKTGVNWKKFYDTNMVDIRYQPFNAANWQPVPSGLLSPVKLVLEK